MEQSGLYTIVVSENLRDQTVSYALALDRIDPPSPAARLIDYNEVIQDEINGVGDVDMFVVNGELGDTVRIGISIVERDVYDRYNGVCYKFYGPDGYSIGAEICNNRSQEFTIPRSGNYSVAVTEFGNDKTVVYGLNLACVSGICPDADVPEVSGCVSTQGTPLNSARVVLSQPDEPEQVARTDASGCYDFRKLVPGKPFDVHVLGSALSE